MTHLISVVDTHDLPQGLLSQLHLESSLKYINPKNYPTYQDLDQGLKFVRRMLIGMDQIVDDTELLDKQDFGGQLARTTVAGNASATRYSILENGLKLNLLPISLLMLPDGKYRLLDGRTRKGIFKEDCSLKNVIADVYEVDDNFKKEKQQLAAHRFAMRANLDEAPKSPFTMDDIVNHTINSVQKKWIKKEDIREEVEYINGNQFTKQKINKIVLQIKNRLEVAKVGIPLCNTYDDKSAQVWLKDIAKIQSNQNNNGIYYITYASSMTGKFVTWLARKYQDLILDIALNNKIKCKELRVVIQTGDLASSDLERSWKDAIDNFRVAFKDKLQDVANTWFVCEGGKSPKIDTKVILYGAIPAVYSLENKYPMDKIVRFKQDLKGKKFSEIDMVKSLDEFLDLE